MPTDQERLVVSLEARIRDFERNMQKASRTGSKAFDDLEARAKQSASRMEQAMSAAAGKVGGALKGFGAGILGGLTAAGISGIVTEIGNVAKGVAEIGDQAKRAGLSNKAFQELAFVAQQSRIPVDALTDGMKELSLRADEFIQTGGGSAAESFKRLGFTAGDLATKLKDPSALFTEIIGKLGQLDKAAQIRIADELFGGTGGEQFVQLLDKGEDGIRKLIQAAHENGAVMDDEMIAKAAELDRQFQIVVDRVGNGLKGAVVSALSAFSDFVAKFNDFTKDKPWWIDQGRVDAAVGNIDAARTMNDLEGKRSTILKDLRDQQAALQNALDNGFGPNSPIPFDQKAAEDSIQALRDQLRLVEEQIAAQKKLTEAKQETAAVDSTMLDEVVVTSPRASFQPSEGAVSEGQRRTGIRTKAQDASSFLDLIGIAEGTDKGRGYNETLGFGAFTGGNKDLVLMSLDQIDALQSQMLRHPNNSFNSSALGRYQIVQKTLRGLRGQMGLSGNELFDADLQDRLASELLRRRGSDPSNLRNEWEGLRNVDAATIARLANGSITSLPSRGGPSVTTPRAAPTQMPGADAWAGMRDVTTGLGQQGTAVDALGQRYEQLGQIGMTAFQGIANALSDGEISASELLSIIGNLIQQLLAMPALPTGTPQAGTGGSGSSIFGSILSGIFGGIGGFATGGHVRGPGSSTSDSIPAMLSNGEYVVRASQAAKHRALLDGINSGDITPFAAGGQVGKGKPFAAPTMGGSSTFAPNIVINQAQGGSPAQNRDASQKMREEISTLLDQKMSEWSTNQMRPGGMFTRRKLGA